MNTNRKMGIVGITAIPVIGVLLVALLGWEDKEFETRLERATAALNEERYADAETVIKQMMAKEKVDDLSFPVAIAAVAAARQKHPERVMEYISLYPADLDINPDAIQQLRELGEELTENAEFTTAEAVLRFLVDRNSLTFRAQRALSRLLVVTGRRLEARKHLTIGRTSVPIKLDELLAAADDNVRVRGHEGIVAAAKWKAMDNSDALVELCLGIDTRSRVDLEDAESRLRKAVRLSPELIAAHVELGKCLLDAGKQDEIPQWNRALPDSARQHPGTWLVRGIWARDHDQPRAAIRCFWEALLRDPTDTTANTQLGRLLHAEGDSEMAKVFLRQGELSRELSELLQKIDRTSQAYIASFEGLIETVGNPLSVKDLDLLHRAAELFHELGREWEAVTAAGICLEIDRNDETAIQFLKQMPVKVDFQVSIPESRDPSRKVDFSKYPLPDFSAESDSRLSAATQGDGDLSSSNVSFVDEASAAGLEFTYFNSPDTSTVGMRMFEWTGGGVAVLDYDRNGFPDLFFSQGCQWPARPDQLEHSDRIFRNFDGERFTEVTSPAGIGDWQFSQGCAVGDFDSDGFPDLYVANIGRNRLYRNNGDGTFTDVSDDCGIQGDRWTTSCLLADVNADGHPDIYDVNYITGEGVYTAMCQHNGVSRACTPTKFKAEQDRLYLNQEDGTFADITDESGIVVNDGVGLGIVAADFSKTGRIDLFVANDAFPNFYFVKQPATAPGNVSFANQAWLNGLAFNRDGRAQACMGVAVGDANGDRLLDMFVTNFYEDYNTLYEQNEAGIFVDASMKAALRQPSYLLLGFGTQFLDGDLDGRPDLVLVNGDIDDFSDDPSRPYRQRPQYFQNVGRGRFSEIPPEKLGPFFAKEQLGRGLARLDWNGDGREDFVVSHLDTAAALLSNATQSAGNFVAVQLSGTVSNRDAIGASVTVQCGDSAWMQQLTAGDGYMASNQRQLIFGLGAHDQIDRLTISWPSGQRSEFVDLPVGGRLAFVESDSDGYVLP